MIYYSETLEKEIKGTKNKRYCGFRAGGLAEVSLKLLVAGASHMHDAVADDAGDDAAHRREGKEEGLGVAGLPHQPSPRIALLPQERHALRFPPLVSIHRGRIDPITRTVPTC